VLIPFGTSQINFQFTGIAVPNGAEITLGVDNSLGLTPVQVGTAALAAWTNANMEDQYVGGMTLVNIHVKNGPNATGPQGDVTAGVTGGLGGTAVPPNTTVLIRKNTGSGGRRGAGRIYMPGMDEADVSGGGDLTPVRQAAVQGFWDAFETELTAADIGPILLHADAVEPPYTITSFSVQSLTATQRRRLRR
jgi:hypothetical protein